MLNFSFVILYVENPITSAAFYADLLGHPPIETAPTFSMLALREGVMLGLWAKTGVMPPANAVGGSEVTFTVADAAEVKRIHADWKARGLSIAQAPTQMDFGFTCVALDPDGHRLRLVATGGGNFWRLPPLE
jgi:predicted enzyme related to lactoylglutathione lyase